MDKADFVLMSPTVQLTKQQNYFITGKLDLKYVQISGRAYNWKKIRLTVQPSKPAQEFTA